MTKHHGAFLTIGELAADLDIPQHILRYWETRFPMLRPLQRAGNRRYYRAEDVALAKRIHHLLNVEGYTVRGAQQALSGKSSGSETASMPAAKPAGCAAELSEIPPQSPTGQASQQHAELIGKLKNVKALLEAAL